MKMNTSSPHDKLPILEEGWRCEKDNNIFILKRIEKRSSWSRFLEIVKIILYLELIFFIGWVGCIFLTDHIGNVNACGTSAIKYTPSDINNQIDHKHSVTGIRDKRTIEEDELKRESCRSNMNVTRGKIDQLTNQFILGEDSDANILMLRGQCRLEIASLTFRVMMDKLISTTYSSDPTEEQWRTFALNIKQEIINSTGEEYRQQVDASGPPTPEIVNDLRTAIESMIRDYKDCEKVIPIDDASTTPSIGDLLKERDKCERIGVTLKEISRPLIVQIIPGDSSDPSIIQLREQVENITTLMAVALSFDTRQVWSLDLITEQVANLTNEKWREYISTIRNEVLNSTDSEQRQQLETNAPVTQEMINDIRTGVNKHIANVRNCDELNVVINDLRNHVEDDHIRLKRDSNPTSKHGLLDDYLKNDVLNMVNLFALRNSDLIQ